MMGERLLWYRIASHLKTTVTELAGKITYTEFWDWLRFLEIEETRRTKQDYYLAQVAQYLKMALVKNPGTVKLGDCLLDLSISTEDPRERVKKSKAAWGMATGAPLKRN